MKKNKTENGERNLFIANEAAAGVGGGVGRIEIASIVGVDGVAVPYTLASRYEFGILVRCVG